LCQPVASVCMLKYMVELVIYIQVFDEENVRMSLKHSVRLVWDGKDEDPARLSCEQKLLEHIYPHPVRHSSNLFNYRFDWENQRDKVVSNRLIQGDNLFLLGSLIKEGYEEMFDLIYIDPPFLSDTSYISRAVITGNGDKEVINRLAFRDTWEKGLDSYLDALYGRLQLMKRLLSEQGSIFVHLDWHVSHYVKLLLDEIFLLQNFINEIVWCYGGGSGTKRHFHRKHDLILWYSKGDKYIFNPQYRPYTIGTLERGLTRVKGDKYQLHQKGALMQDWWTDINKILSPTARENLKYPTQKPAALVKRIIAAASNPGSLVADFYCGSGTTARVCEEMERNWVAADTSSIAVQTTISRLIKYKSRPFKVERIEAKGNVKEPGNIIKLKKPQIYKAKDVFNICLGIENYTPAPEKRPLLREEYAVNSIIDFWEIDFDYNGEVFCSDIQVVRDKNSFDKSLELDFRFQLPIKKEYYMAIKVYDIFGDNALITLTLKP